MNAWITKKQKFEVVDRVTDVKQSVVLVTGKVGSNNPDHELTIHPSLFNQTQAELEITQRVIVVEQSIEQSQCEDPQITDQEREINADTNNCDDMIKDDNDEAYGTDDEVEEGSDEDIGDDEE